MSMTVTRYAIKDYDDLENIAETQLGTRGRWGDLVALNKLRAPYISPIILDQFGPVIGQLLLQQPLLPGTSMVPAWDTSRDEASISLLVPGSVIAFVTAEPNGDQFFEAALLDHVDRVVSGGSGHIFLSLSLLPIMDYRSLTRTLTLNPTAGIQRVHPAGSLFLVFGNPFLLTTAVARVGDVLSLPIALRSSGVQTLAVTPTVDALGTDIALDATGQKRLSPTGDLASVSGVDNLKQAIRIRINTVPGELGLHTNYGCGLQFYIGANQDSVWPGLAQSLVKDALLQDARINQIKDSSFQKLGDASFINVQIEIAEGSQIVSETITLPV